MKLVFDTSIIIDALRRKSRAKEALLRFEESDDEIMLPSIVGFELFSGESSRKSGQARSITAFLKYFEIVDLNWSIATKAGEIFRGGVKGLGVTDYIVAATALEMGAEVVTLNEKYFVKIPGLSIYPL